MINYSFYNSPVTATGYLEHTVSRGEEVLCERIRAEPGPLLDIGCGAGRLHTRLSGVCGGLIGLDYAAEQLRVYRDRFPRARLVEASAVDLPFADGAFRTALMGYHLIESILPAAARADAVADAARVLADGGSLFLARHVRRNYHLGAQVSGFALRRVGEFGDLGGPARPMGPHQHTEWFAMHVLSRKEMARLAAGAGLRLVAEWDFDTGGPVRGRSRAVAERYVRGTGSSE